LAAIIAPRKFPVNFLVIGSRQPRLEEEAIVVAREYRLGHKTLLTQHVLWHHV
jgi:hypothetical protein